MLPDNDIHCIQTISHIIINIAICYLPLIYIPYFPSTPNKWQEKVTTRPPGIFLSVIRLWTLKQYIINDWTYK